MLLGLFGSAFADIPCKAEQCRKGPYQVNSCSVSVTPARNINSTIHMSGLAGSDMNLSAVTMEVKLNGIHLENETFKYPRAYDQGDRTIWDYTRFIPSFSPSGNYTLEFNF